MGLYRRWQRLARFFSFIWNSIGTINSTGNDLRGRRKPFCRIASTFCGNGQPEQFLPNCQQCKLYIRGKAIPNFILIW
jgi:hypothetical protein